MPLGSVPTRGSGRPKRNPCGYRLGLAAAAIRQPVGDRPALTASKNGLPGCRADGDRLVAGDDLVVGDGERDAAGGHVVQCDPARRGFVARLAGDAGVAGHVDRSHGDGAVEDADAVSSRGGGGVQRAPRRTAERVGGHAADRRHGGRLEVDVGGVKLDLGAGAASGGGHRGGGQPGGLGLRIGREAETGVEEVAGEEALDLGHVALVALLLLVGVGVGAAHHGVELGRRRGDALRVLAGLRPPDLAGYPGQGPRPRRGAGCRTRRGTRTPRPRPDAASARRQRVVRRRRRAPTAGRARGETASRRPPCSRRPSRLTIASAPPSAHSSRHAGVQGAAHVGDASHRVRPAAR